MSDWSSDWGAADLAVARGAVAVGREKRVGGLRHARLVPPSAMLHNPPMAGAMGDAEKTDAPAKAWLAGLRAAMRAIVDYALPPRCPGCGVIVGDDRPFCISCWAALDCLGGPGCAPLFGRGSDR